MAFRLCVLTLALAGLTVGSPSADSHTGDTPPAHVRINNLKVLSSNIDDTTTVENILHSFIKPGMTQAQRADALWTAAVKYRHQTTPPNEYLSGEWEAHDPVKLFNVYGYCMCCCASSIIESLNRADGREARGRILNGHSVAEVNYDGGWHMFDCSLITQFPEPGTGSIAGVDEITQAVRDWYKTNPGYQGNGAKLLELMRGDGWTGWKEHGPALLANCPYNTMGYYPARTHGWDATMQEYNLQSGVYEYGYQIGHRALFSLRPGESLERDAGNHGLHVNEQADPHFAMLTEQVPNGDLAYVPRFDPGYSGGVVANGYHRYAPDLTCGDLKAGALEFQNLACGPGSSAQPRLHAVRSDLNGTAVIEMTSPYVYLGGRVTLETPSGRAPGSVTVEISTNNGLTFQPLWSYSPAGSGKVVIQLGDRLLRRYEFQLRLTITGAGAGLNTLAVEADIQHAPRTLPWLRQGSNTITVAANSDPGIATRTVNCRITPDAQFKLNETATRMGITFNNLKVTDGGGCWWQGGQGEMTVPIETPGDIAALRFGAHVRVRSERDLVQMLLSFDGGKTWVPAAEIHGPTPGITRYFRYTQVPPHVRRALLRFALTGNNTAGVFTFRLDADYLDPLAAPMAPATQPFTVEHRWKEQGAVREYRARVTHLPFSYAIDTKAPPAMLSVTYSMASLRSGGA